jgi:hypothetical protein
MPRMLRSTKKPTAPPSRAVLERRKDEFKWESHHAREELLRAHIDHLQRAAITPLTIEREAPQVSAVYRDCLALDLRTVSVRDVVTLHTRICQAIAFSLWMDGEVDPTRAKILKLLADAIEVGNGRRTGWQSKDGVPINLADLDGVR